MPVIMEQVDRMNASEKMRLIEYLLKSISTIVENQDSGAARKDPREAYFGYPRPDFSKLIGYGAKFHNPRSTAEWMKELREGEAAGRVGFWRGSSCRRPAVSLLAGIAAVWLGLKLAS